METNNKKLNSLIEGLGKSTTIFATLEKIRDKGNVQIIPYLLDLYFNSQNIEVEKKVKSILFDLKDNNAIPYIFEAIEKNKEHTAFLISIFWEAGLDCSTKTNELISLALEGNALVIIEVMSVLENLELKFSTEEKNSFRTKITETILKSSDETKKVLLENLLENINN